jgi:hypothetical protein
MKLVLRIVGIVLAVVGGFLLLAGRSAATDPIGVIVLLVMGGLPLALGVFLIWKSMGTSNKKEGPLIPDNSDVHDAPDVPAAATEEPIVAAGSNVPPQPSVPPMPKADKPLYKKYTFKVAGISRRQKDITSKLLPENSDYLLSKSDLVEIGAIDERIYKYSPIELDAELVLEPDNPRDPNAIKVLADGVQLGYVPADKTGKVKSLLEKKQIHTITSAFYGGPYKIIHEDFDPEREKEVYTIEKDSQYNIGAEVTIEYK